MAQKMINMVRLEPVEACEKLGKLGMAEIQLEAFEDELLRRGMPYSDLKSLRAELLSMRPIAGKTLYQEFNNIILTGFQITPAQYARRNAKV